MKNNFKNFLLINFGGIGDEILFLPVIHSLKKQYPDSKITLALENRSKVIKDLTYDIDKVISVDIKSKFKYFNLLKFILKTWFLGFDCVISSGKSPFIAIILFLTGIKKRIGYKTKTACLLTDFIELNEDQYAAKMYHDLIKPIANIEFENPKIEITGDFNLPDNTKANEYIALHPGVSLMSVSKNIFKCPNTAFWLSLIKGILDKNKKLILLGTKDDSDIVEKILQNDEIKNNKNFINYYQKTKNIMEMAYIMKNAESVICVDSAPLHVAVSVKAKTYAIFGPTNEKKLIPENENIILIKNDIPCRPCLWHKRQTNCENSECLNLDFNLILDKIY